MSVSKILYKSFYWKLLHFLLSLFTTIALAHILKPAGSAAFYSFLYFFSLIIAFFSFGLDVGLNYFLARKELAPRKASIIILLLTAVALLVSLPCIYFFYTPGVTVIFSIKEMVLFAGLQITGGLFSSLSGTIFTAYHKNYIATRILIVFGAIFLAIIIGTNYFFPARNSTAVFYIWYLVIFLQGTCMFLYSYYKYPEKSASREPLIIILKKVFRFSFVAFVVNFIFFAAGKFPAFILPYWVTASEAGNYIQAYKLLEYAGASVAFIYFPIVAIAAKDGEEKMQHIILFLVRLFNTLMVTGSIILLLLGKLIFPFIFGSSFNSMYGVFVCLIPALIVSCSSSFFTAYFFGKGYLKYNLISACILLLTLFFLLYPLTELYGIQGTALALSIGSVLSFLLDIYWFRKHHFYRVTDMLLIKREDIGFIYSFLFKPAQDN